MSAKKLNKYKMTIPVTGRRVRGPVGECPRVTGETIGGVGCASETLREALLADRVIEIVEVPV